MQRLLCVIGSFRLTRNGLLRQTANRTANIPPATIRENLRFAASDHLLAVLPDFQAERLRDCHLGIQSAGKPSETGFSMSSSRIRVVARQEPPQGPTGANSESPSPIG